MDKTPVGDPLAGMIVHEDEDILVVNKPPGMLTSSGPKDERPTLWRTVQARARAQKWRKPMGIIHRLDRDACGLLVFSKNNDAYQSLKTQFFRHTVERIYMAIVSGTPNPPEGTIDNYLDEWKDGTVHKARMHGKGERAVSHYQTHSVVKKTALVRIKLETGRKHQIRVHMAGINHPIVGDPFYHPQGRTGDTLMLVAKRLCFIHPRTGKWAEFEIPLPDHMRKHLRELGDPDPDGAKNAAGEKPMRNRGVPAKEGRRPQDRPGPRPRPHPHPRPRAEEDRHPRPRTGPGPRPRTGPGAHRKGGPRPPGQGHSKGRER